MLETIITVYWFGMCSSVWCRAKIFYLDQAAFSASWSSWPHCSFMYESFPRETTLWHFETSVVTINMSICTVYVSGQSDLGLCISPTECIMWARSVNTALQNGRNSNQSALFTLKLRTLHLWGKGLLCFCSGSNTGTNVRYPFEVFSVSLCISVRWSGEGCYVKRQWTN